MLRRAKQELPRHLEKSLRPDEQRDLIGEILFDLVHANQSLLVKVLPLMKEAQRLGGEQSMKEAADATGGLAGAFNVKDPRAVQDLRRREIQITGANRTIRRRLAHTLADGLESGETIDQVGDRIREEFKIAGNRARTIARTEIGGAVEDARGEGRRQANVPLKSWLWSRKEHGRRAHAYTEIDTMKQPIPDDQDFIIHGTGIACPHPRASGVAGGRRFRGQDINCSCIGPRSNAPGTCRPWSGSRGR